MSHLLEMQSINKSFGTNKVLEDVHLHLDKGEVLAILGENGAGKSTLIKILGGIYSADSGKIFIEGEPKNITSVSEAAANGISIIHQEIILVPHRTVAADVFLGRELTNSLGFVDAKRMESETQKIIDDLGINLSADQLVSDLTIGMQQLVEIIKAISVDAKIVVMDEPTSSLSQKETETLFKIIEQLKAKGVGIIYISHRLEELFRITDRIVVLRDGYIVGDVRTSEAEKDTLISMMVGRDLDRYYVKNKHPLQGEALRVENLSDGERFSDISFHSNYGEIVGFAGLVGAGRSELMKSIFGLRPLKSGKIFLDGQEITIKKPADAISRGIVYVPEDRRKEGLILNNTALFNVGLASLPNLVSNLKVKKDKWLNLLRQYQDKLSIRLSSPQQDVWELSGGNQQKIVLSKWLATNPSVIIMDEPTRGVDVGVKSEIYKIIDDLAANGVAVIIVSSELPEIINICHRCYVLSEGKLTGELTEEEFSQEKIMALATTV